MELNLKNKVVLITGSSYGIGFYIAKSFIEEGSKVIITSRYTKNLDKTKKNLTKLSNNKNIFFEKVNFNNLKSVKNLKNNLKNKNLQIDILVNNLGSGKGSKTLYPSKKQFLSSFDKNFISAFETTKEFLDTLIKNKGNVIFISSITSLEILKAPMEYSISKTAINSFSKQLSILYGEKIRVNTVIPGNILIKNNNWWKKLQKDKSKTINYIKQNVPQKRFGKPEEVANLVKFLSSYKAEFINGAAIVIDGGQNKSLY
tara:strand:- start:1336 stop:2109 length:774 start_codon:yes stop_codon:yes gene_type:complete